jgi:hypothetical protein
MRVERMMLVGMWKVTLIREISHERAALGSASRETCAFGIEQFSPNRRFPSVISGVANPWQGDAVGIPKWIRANAAGPTGIMPRHAYRDVTNG